MQIQELVANFLAPGRQLAARASVLLTTALLATLLLLEVPRAVAQESLCTRPDQSVSLPLTELANSAYTRMDGQQTSFQGGLYPEGSNSRPAGHEASGREVTARIVPLDGSGAPDPANGRIVMIAVGMSNTQMEFGAFMDRVKEDPAVNPRLTLVNGAQSSRTAEFWADPSSPAWQELNARLTHAGVTSQQVQVAWVKQTHTRGGEFPAKALALQADLEAIARNLKTHFPNIRIAYFSSRTRSYLYGRGLSPEPNAFETGFSVKWMIERQITGVPELNFDPNRGTVRAPYLSWGPYLWINGTTPRADGRIWRASELVEDCTHPSMSGRALVAEMMLEFFASDSTTGWFRGETSPSPTPTPTLTSAPATVTSTASPSATATQPTTTTPTAGTPLALPLIASGGRSSTQPPDEVPSDATQPTLVTSLTSGALAPRSSVSAGPALIILAVFTALVATRIRAVAQNRSSRPKGSGQKD